MTLKRAVWVWPVAQEPTERCTGPWFESLRGLSISVFIFVGFAFPAMIMYACSIWTICHCPHHAFIVMPCLMRRAS
jgi:hypothetical protein